MTPAGWHELPGRVRVAPGPASCPRAKGKTLRRFLVAALALLLIPALALAGKTVTSGKNTLKIKADVRPGRRPASRRTSRGPLSSRSTTSPTRPTAAGSRRRCASSWSGRAARSSASSAFPACDETDALEQGDGVCPDGSLVGEGTGVAEVRARSRRSQQGHGPVGRREGLQRRARHRQERRSDGSRGPGS